MLNNYGTSSDLIVPTLDVQKVSFFFLLHLLLLLMGKTTDTIGRSKFWLPKSSPFCAKTCAAVRANNINLHRFKLHSEF